MSNALPGQRNAIVPLSVMMFLQFFVWGAWYITVGGYMAKIGLGDSIGHAYTVGPIAAIISPFFLGMVADRFFASERVLGVMHVLGGVALLAAPSLAEYSVRLAAGLSARAAGEAAPFLNMAHLPFLLALLAHMLCYMPTLGLTNTVCFHNMGSPEKQFPLVRVFGTIGWIAAGWVFGLAAPSLIPASVDAANKDAVNGAIAGLPHFFYLAGGAGVALGLFSFMLPHTPPPAAGKPASVRDALGLDALALLRQPAFLVFTVCSFLICIPLAAYYAYAPLFVGQTGTAPGDVPKVMSYGQMSEIVFMLAMPLCFARLGVKWMLAAGMLAWVVRYGLFSAAVSQHAAWMVLAGVILHGICYDFFFVTGFIYVDKKAPKEIRGQAQGLLVLVTQGLGLGVGAQVCGRVFTAHTSAGVTDWRSVWMVPCWLALGVLVVFVLGFRERGRSAAVSGG